MKPSEILDPAARDRIVAAVRSAEADTSGEIVVVVVRECDEYGAAGWLCGVTLAALVLLALSLLLPPLPGAAYLAAQALAVAAGHAIARLSAVRRLFVAEATMEARAERRAAAAFAERGLRHTRNRTGILILVALFEHRVIVLGDSGIDEAMGPGESWEEIVELALSGIERGDPVAGIVAAVERCGEILSHPLPAGPDNPDEIHEALVIED